MLSPKELISQAEALLRQATDAEPTPVAPAALVVPTTVERAAPKGQPSVYETYMSVAKATRK